MVRDAVQFASFENMRRLERDETFQSGGLEPGDRSDEESYKSRQGEVDGYDQYLDAEQVSRLNGVIRCTLDPSYPYPLED